MDSESAVRRTEIKSLVFLSLILSPQATRISIAADREKGVSPQNWAAQVSVWMIALKTLTLAILYCGKRPLQ